MTRNIDPTQAANDSKNFLEGEIESTTGAIVSDVVTFANDDASRPAFATLSFLQQLQNAVRGVVSRAMTTDGSNALLGGQNVMQALGGSAVSTQADGNVEFADLAQETGAQESEIQQEFNNLVAKAFRNVRDAATRRRRSTVAEKVMLGDQGYEVEADGRLRMEHTIDNTTNSLRPYQPLFQALQGKSNAERDRILAQAVDFANGTPASGTDQEKLTVLGKIVAAMHSGGRLNRDDYVFPKSTLTPTDRTTIGLPLGS